MLITEFKLKNYLSIYSRVAKPITELFSVPPDWRGKRYMVEAVVNVDYIDFKEIMNKRIKFRKECYVIKGIEKFAKLNHFKGDKIALLLEKV